MDTRARTFNRQIAEEAATWFVDFSAGDVDAAALEQFNRWLRTSPEHVRAYLQLAAFWEEAELLKLDSAEMERLAREIALAGNVVPLQVAASAESAAQSQLPAVEGEAPRVRSATWRFAVAACTALFGVAIAAFVWMRMDQGALYATETGEQRSVTLEDGSIVQLNSQSRLRVQFTHERRAVELLQGQALFEVAKNPARPFVVLSGSTSVQAVGTQFDVYRRATGTVVTVVEGKVSVASAATRTPARLPSGPESGSVSATPMVPAPVLLSAGERIVVTEDEALLPQPADVAMATAWTQNKLVFDGAPLTEVVAEFNRYSRRPLVIEDAALDGVHISGVFSSTSVDHLVEFLEQRFPVEVKTDDEQIRISRRQ